MSRGSFRKNSEEKLEFDAVFAALRAFADGAAPVRLIYPVIILYAVIYIYIYPIILYAVMRYNMIRTAWVLHPLSRAVPLSNIICSEI